MSSRKIDQGVFRLFHVFVGQRPQEQGFYTVWLDTENDVDEEDRFAEFFEADVTTRRQQIAVSDNFVNLGQICQQILSGRFIGTETCDRLLKFLKALEVARLAIDGLCFFELIASLPYLLCLLA